MLLPVIATIVLIPMTALAASPAIVMLVQNQEAKKLPPMGYVFVFLSYFIGYFIMNFFNASMLFAAREALEGRPTSMRDGIHGASKHVWSILGWSFIAATIGTILRVVAEEMGFVGKIVISLLGAAWNIVTFFTVPMLVLNGVGPIAAIKGSWATIKQVWGETAIGNFGIGTAVMLMALLPVPILIGLAVLGNLPVMIAAAALCLIYWCVLGAVSSSLNGIYMAAVFNYAQTGSVSGKFSHHFVVDAFVPKPEKKSKLIAR